MFSFEKILKKIKLNIIKFKKIQLNKIKIDKNILLLAIALLAAVVTIVLVVSVGRSSTKTIAQRSIDYINKNILTQGQSAGQSAVLESSSKESGVIKIKLKIGDNSYDSYATQDGKLFFPQAFSMDSKKK